MGPADAQGVNCSAHVYSHKARQLSVGYKSIHGLQFQEMDYVIASVENMKEAVRVCHCSTLPRAAHSRMLLNRWLHVFQGAGYEVYSTLCVL